MTAPQATVQKVANQINEVLLSGTGEGRECFDGFHGDLAVALAAVEIPVAALAVPSTTTDPSVWQLVEKQVKDAVAAAKAGHSATWRRGLTMSWKTAVRSRPAETH